MKSISYVERIDFANKALNQAGKIVKEAKSKAPNKTKEIKANYAYGTSRNQIEMLNGTLCISKTLLEQEKL
jgi:hydroxylamine reductase (hybrid-cluster protein)